MKLNAPIVALFAVLLFPIIPVYAFESPEALVEAIYAPYRDHQKVSGNDRYFSDSLRQILNAKLKRDNLTSLSFDPFVNAQDFLLHDLQIGAPSTILDRASVNVSFFNFDHPTALTLSLVKEANGWKVDDIAALGVERHWLLSWLLTFDPFEE